MNRVRLFVSLPFHVLDQAAIKQELSKIGKSQES